MTGLFTVNLYAGPTMLRGRTVAAPPPRWPAKDPSDIRKFGVNFAGLIGCCGSSIASIDVRVAEPVDLVTSSFAGSVVTVELGGGTDGQLARIEIITTLADGEVVTGVVLLPIVQLRTLPPPPSDVLPVLSLQSAAVAISWAPAVPPVLSLISATVTRS